MTNDTPAVAGYLSRLDQGLRGLAPVERNEVLLEIRNHIAEAAAAGKPLDAVLQSLGPADALARAYAVELLLRPRTGEGRMPRLERFLKLTGLIVVGSIPSFVVVTVLGVVGLTFLAVGAAVFAAGILGTFGTLPPWIHMDVDPRFAILIGPALAVAGAAAAYGLVLYVKWLVRAVRRLLPRGGQATGRSM